MARLAAYTGKELAAETDPFARARDLGFDAIEIAGIVLPLPTDGADLHEWSDRLERLGLVARFHCSPKHNREFYSQDSRARSQCIDLTLRDLEGASRLGIRSVVIHPSTAAGPEDRRRVVEAIACLQRRAEPLGIGLELECASGPFNGDPRELVSLCEAVPGIGIALDIAHAARSVFCREQGNTVVDWIQVAAPYIKSVQFNDVTTEGGRHVQTPVGQGDIPYEMIMPQVLKSECPWWTIELQKTRHLVESKKYLDPFLSQHRP